MPEAQGPCAPYVGADRNSVMGVRRPLLKSEATDARVLQALALGPLTEAQINQRLGLSRYGSARALRILLSAGRVVTEPFEGSAKRHQYRVVHTMRSE